MIRPDHRSLLAIAELITSSRDVLVMVAIGCKADDLTLRPTLPLPFQACSVSQRTLGG